MNKLVTTSLVILIFATATAFFYHLTDSPQSGSAIKEIHPGKIHLIEITPNGFFPEVIEIKQYDKIQFVNIDDKEHWPASNVHPTHEVYPGTGIEKCGTHEQEKIFDACKGLKKDESFTFQFNLPGKWGYHDHLNPMMHGIISVESKDSLNNI